VRADEATVRAALADLPEVRVANANAPSQVVVAGPKVAIEDALALLEARGLTATPLAVAAAFHTPLVGHAREAFAAELAATPIAAPRAVVYANATGEPYPAEPDAIRARLSSQLLEPVRFQDEIERIYADGGRLFVEIGPRDVLTNLVGEILGDRPHVAIALNPSRRRDSDRQLREALARLRVAGLPIDARDPYRRTPDPAPPRKKGGAVVQLNGSNYVSEQRQRAYRDALENGHRIAEPAPVDTTPAPPAVPPATSVAASGDVERVLASIDRGLHEFAQLQTETLRAHQQFVAEHAEQSRAYLEFMSQQQSLLLAPSAAAVPPGVQETLARSMTLFQELQRDTLRVHERYLEGQTEQARGYFGALAQAAGATSGVPGLSAMPATAASRPIPPPAAAFGAPTAPPTAMPPTAAPASAAPPLAGPLPGAQPIAAWPAVPPDAPAPPAWPAPATSSPPASPAPVGWAADASPAVSVPYANGAPPLVPAAAPPSVPAPHANDSPPPIAAAVPPTVSAPSNGPELTLEAVTTALLEVVAEKTGYPTDTLELDMDVEADLGIDSIKRVEILGAMRKRFPSAPNLKPEELAELRTLQQIVDYLARNQPAEAPLAAAPAASNGRADSPSVTWYPVRLKSLPPPDRLSVDLPPDTCCVVTDDGSALTVAVVAALQEIGWPVAVLGLPSALVPGRASLPSQVARAALDALDEPSIEAALTALSRRHPIGAFVHLHPTGGPALLGAEDEAIVKAVFLLARQLKAPLIDLAAADGAHRAAFAVVTRLGGELGLTDSGAGGAVAGGLFGLTKTLALEWPGVHCRAIDADAGAAPEAVAGQLVAELLDPNRTLVEVGYGPSGRVTPVAAEPVASGR
jgi:acyl carrier protein